MTIKEAITQTDFVKPNQYGDQEKTRWLSQIDGMIWNEVVSHYEEGETPTPYQYPKDAAKELLVPDPYADLYIKYLSAQIDFSNAEYGRYNNGMVLFNAIYTAFQNDCRIKYLPKQKNRLKNFC